MSLIQWRRPRMPSLFDQVERALEEMMPRHLWSEAAEYEVIPPVDVYETDGEVVVRAELPGTNKEDVSVTATDDRVVLSGETTITEEVDEEGYYRRELRYGSFRRSVALPAAINPDEVEAKFADGVLEVRAPKAVEAAEGKAIEIQ